MSGAVAQSGKEVSVDAPIAVQGAGVRAGWARLRRNRSSAEGRRASESGGAARARRLGEDAQRRPPYILRGVDLHVYGQPGKHGILGFTRAREGSHEQEVVRSGDVRAPQLWDHLSAAGKRSIVFNLPNLYPATALNGVMVTGLLTPHDNSDWCYPGELSDELVAAGLGFMKQPSVHRLRRMNPERAEIKLGRAPQDEESVLEQEEELVVERLRDLGYV